MNVVYWQWFYWAHVVISFIESCWFLIQWRSQTFNVGFCSSPLRREISHDYLNLLMILHTVHGKQHEIAVKDTEQLAQDRQYWKKLVHLVGPMLRDGMPPLRMSPKKKKKMVKSPRSLAVVHGERLGCLFHDTFYKLTSSPLQMGLFEHTTSFVYSFLVPVYTLKTCCWHKIQKMPIFSKMDEAVEMQL